MGLLLRMRWKIGLRKGLLLMVLMLLLLHLLLLLLLLLHIELQSEMLLLLEAELLLCGHVIIWLDGRAWCRGYVCGLLGVRIYDDNVAFLEVVDESVEVGEIKATAGIIAALGTTQVSR